jgi:hypothetical protein
LRSKVAISANNPEFTEDYWGKTKTQKKQYKYILLQNYIDKMLTTPIFHKIPGMIYSGFITGFILEILIPNDETKIKKRVVFAGICIATWTSYYLQN